MNTSIYPGLIIDVDKMKYRKIMQEFEKIKSKPFDPNKRIYPTQAELDKYDEYCKRLKENEQK